MGIPQSSVRNFNRHSLFLSPAKNKSQPVLAIISLSLHDDSFNRLTGKAIRLLPFKKNGRLSRETNLLKFPEFFIRSQNGVGNPHKA
jgi:hypothetical protein